MGVSGKNIGGHTSFHGATMTPAWKTLLVKLGETQALGAGLGERVSENFGEG